VAGDLEELDGELLVDDVVLRKQNVEHCVLDSVARLHLVRLEGRHNGV